MLCFRCTGNTWPSVFWIVISYAFHRCGICIICINEIDRSDSFYIFTGILIVLDDVVFINTFDVTDHTADTCSVCCAYRSLKGVVLNILDTVVPALYHTGLRTKDTTYIVISCDRSVGIAVLNRYTWCVRRRRFTPPCSAVSAAGNTTCVISACSYGSVELTVFQCIGSHRLTFVSADTAYVFCSVDICVTYAVLDSSVEVTTKGTDIGLCFVISDHNTFFYSTVGDGDLVLSGCISSDKSGFQSLCSCF